MRARESSAGRRNAAIALAVIALVTAAFLVSNIHAPVQRDGAHFLFMAVNIAAGQPPYWASFETKNPLVEYLWAFAVVAWNGGSPVVAARIVEHAYLALTAFAIYLFVARSLAHEEPRGKGLAAAVGIAAAAFYLCVALDFRVTDDGFNIALYQSLPELLAIGAALQVARTASPAAAAIAGLCCFLAWFTKQTSLITLVFPLFAVLLVAARRPGFARCALAFVLAAVVPPGLWFACLAVTQTLDNYLLGTLSYRAGISALLWPEFGRNVAALFELSNPRDPHALVFQYNRVIAWLLPFMTAAAVAAGILRFRRGDRAGALVIAVVALWLLGAFAQAVAGLTFFRHYFLACIGPAVLVAAILARSAGRPMALAFVAVAGGTSIFWAWKYIGWAPDIEARARQAPMTHTVQGLRPLLPPGAKVYNWNGLPHFHAMTGRASDYPLNSWWPWIITSVPEPQRDRRLQDLFRESPPDAFLEVFEAYPPNQGLVGVALTPELLLRWTGKTYALAGTVTPPAGRYGAPARVFKRLE